MSKLDDIEQAIKDLETKLMDRFEVINEKLNVINDKLNTKPIAKAKGNRPPPSVSDYKITFLRNADSGKAKLIQYKGDDMWLPNGCIKSSLTEIENTDQTATIQDWIIKEKLKEIEEALGCEQTSENHF